MTEYAAWTTARQHPLDNQLPLTARSFARIEEMRRVHPHPRIAFELKAGGGTISRRTVSRHLMALGLNHRRFIDPNGENNREPGRSSPDDRGILAEEFLYAHERDSEDERTATIEVCSIHYNFHRPHRAADGQPPASRAPAAVTNVLAPYSQVYCPERVSVAG